MATDVVDLPMPAVEREITTLAGHLAAGTCRFLQLLAAFDAGGGWHGNGMRTCAQWLSWRCGLSTFRGNAPAPSRRTGDSGRGRRRRRTRVCGSTSEFRPRFRGNTDRRVLDAAHAAVACTPTASTGPTEDPPPSRTCCSPARITTCSCTKVAGNSDRDPTGASTPSPPAAAFSRRLPRPPETPTTCPAPTTPISHPTPSPAPGPATPSTSPTPSASSPHSAGIRRWE